MNDTIYRQAAIDAVNTWFELYALNRTAADAMSIQDMLRALLSAEPERKTGRWIEEHIDITDKERPKSFRFHRCSACGHVAAPALFVDEEKWLSYCPHCGAYMKG